MIDVVEYDIGEFEHSPTLEMGFETLIQVLKLSSNNRLLPYPKLKKVSKKIILLAILLN
jgi:hypothetical protein